VSSAVQLMARGHSTATIADGSPSSTLNSISVRIIEAISAPVVRFFSALSNSFHAARLTSGVEHASLSLDSPYGGVVKLERFSAA
jgi:hypothetical protein